MNYYNLIKKGTIFNKPCTDFKIRFIIIDYDCNFVYCIDLNSKNKLFRKVVKFTYEELDKFSIE